MNNYLQDYLNQGLCDHLQDPRRFMESMESRHWTLFEYYLAGVTALEQWYGDKAYREYDDWFDALDIALLHAENHFKGRFGDE